MTSVPGYQFHKSMSSRARQERLRQLEQEREYFYRQKNISNSSSFAAGMDQTTESPADFTSIKQRLGIHSDGRQYFTTPSTSATAPAPYQAFQQQPQQPQQPQQQPQQFDGPIPEKLPSQRLVDDILNATKFDFSASSSKANSARPQKGRVDAFEKMVSKDSRVRQRYQVSDKNLLEDERARNAALEDSYAQLLRQVQQLQNTHLLDLRNSEQRFHAASAALQKALVSKSEELVSLSNKLASSDGRYERDNREWQKERISLVAHVETLSTASAEQINKIADREKRLAEMNKLRKELAERIALREQDLIKYGKALRDREADYISEKETRLKLEAKVQNLELHQAERDSQFRDLQTQLHKKILETEELAGLKIVFSEAKRDIEDFTRREKYYNTEIEQMANRERKLFSQVEELTASERKYAQELGRLGDRQAALVKDLEERQVREERMSRDLHESQTKNVQQDSELAKYEKQLRQAQLDTSKLLQEYSNLQATFQESQMANQNLTKDLLIARNNEEVLQKERDNALSKIATLSKDLGSKQRECEEQKEEIRQLVERLELEKQQQNELRQQSKEKFGVVTTKITELQDTLVETQTQLADLRANEKNMRGTLRQKEDALKAQTVVLSDAEAKIQELLSSSAKEAIEFEQFKNKKRDEILAIQDKYTQAKQSMDSEVTQLRHQLQQKHTQYNTLSEDFSELKTLVSELAAVKLSLENKLTELSANDSSQQRQIANLTTTINQKNQEIARLSTKHATLVDQTKRLDDELNVYRDNNSSARDADINRLQSNMEEISKRLKTQVDVMMEKDADTSQFSHTRSISSASTSSPGRPAASSSSRYAAVPVGGGKTNPALASLNDDFDNLDKLLNRSKISSTTDL